VWSLHCDRAPDGKKIAPRLSLGVSPASSPVYEPLGPPPNDSCFLRSGPAPNPSPRRLPRPQLFPHVSCFSAFVVPSTFFFKRFLSKPPSVYPAGRTLKRLSPDFRPAFLPLSLPMPGVLPWRRRLFPARLTHLFKFFGLVFFSFSTFRLTELGIDFRRF